MNPLKVEKVFKQYGDKTAVNGISFEVGKGEIYGLLGANGAGKTTTMRMVLGLIYPDGGSIQYNGQPYNEGLLSSLGYLPEERGLYPKVKVSDQILYFAKLRGMSQKDADSRLKHWLEKFNVPEYYNKRVEELSKGNQQKIQFIASIIHSPQIVIMDEAFSGLDPVNVELLKSTVKELRDEGATILFSTHRMEHVEELCRNITILHKSNPVLQGSLKEIKKKFPRERIILGTEGDVQGLETIAGVTRVVRHENRYELFIADEAAGRPVLELAMKQSNINRFEILEPTLNEIFIKMVGENHE
ncbi:Linearmycin resistance ATP-binding protein LnrL [Paenibacillus plantiphilus]|uniref:Linearmycin resistance ATP-binding protein LnrL n=1 Tax=Paenibacillus plantiphilus TaxID=2905650 RepID=A0ABM9C9U6_9BACL|nr:ATP-binding cassette domain-containing protein [Paenibacillus plantiphilus]CAH1207933.1 Linearmycin resistance ATP-binding protein LnrL [Paenibacillus plantiphilus]